MNAEVRDQESESVFEQETAEKLRARNRRLRGRLDNGVVLAWSWCCETSSAWVHVTASRAIGDVFDVSAMTTTAPIGPGRRRRPENTCPFLTPTSNFSAQFPRGSVTSLCRARRRQSPGTNTQKTDFSSFFSFVIFLFV